MKACHYPIKSFRNYIAKDPHTLVSSYELIHAITGPVVVKRILSAQQRIMKTHGSDDAMVLLRLAGTLCLG